MHEDVRRWCDPGGELQKPPSIPSVLALLPVWGSGCELSAVPASHLPATILPAITMDDGLLSLWNWVSNLMEAQVSEGL
ncbi:mCG146959 [Mus musculus]|nr:mCG146959 [Mus musculus]